MQELHAIIIVQEGDIEEITLYHSIDRAIEEYTVLKETLDKGVSVLLHEDIEVMDSSP